MTYKAELEQQRNDLYWKLYLNLVTDKDCEFFNVTWKGYNDANWWNNVALFESIKTVKGDKGTEKTFQINFSTGEVKELGEQENDNR